MKRPLAIFKRLNQISGNSLSIFLFGLIIFFIIPFTSLTMTSCAGPSTQNSDKIILKAHKIVITDYNPSKYTQVRFTTQIDIEGHPVTFVGSNGSYGYYYKKYNLNVGDTLIHEVTLIQDDEHFYVEALPLTEYLQTQ